MFSRRGGGARERRADRAGRRSAPMNGSLGCASSRRAPRARSGGSCRSQRRRCVRILRVVRRPESIRCLRTRHAGWSRSTLMVRAGVRMSARWAIPRESSRCRCRWSARARGWVRSGFCSWPRFRSERAVSTNTSRRFEPAGSHRKRRCRRCSARERFAIGRGEAPCGDRAGHYPGSNVQSAGERDQCAEA